MREFGFGTLRNFALRIPVLDMLSFLPRFGTLRNFALRIPSHRNFPFFLAKNGNPWYRSSVNLLGEAYSGARLLFQSSVGILRLRSGWHIGSGWQMRGLATRGCRGTAVWLPQMYGAHACAEGPRDQGGQAAREGHRVSGVPDRDVHGEDQAAHVALEEEQAGFPFPPRSSQDGLEAEEALHVPRIGQREGGEDAPQIPRTLGFQAAPEGAVSV